MAKLAEPTIEDKFFAILAYLGILFLIPLLLKRDNKWVQLHAKQGFIMFLGWILSWIPLLGWILAVYLTVVWIIAIIKIFMGIPYWKIPVVGDIAEKINF
ncbi:MAG: hypothetical protein V3V78_02940 [Candidatus Woesearchaeota archaeon]